jgi:hypothetical protein
MPRIFSRIPYGLLHLDGGGKVLDCESSGHTSIIGRNLFTEVPSFQRAAHLPLCYREFLRSGEDACEIDLTVEGAQGDDKEMSAFGCSSGASALTSSSHGSHRPEYKATIQSDDPDPGTLAE